MEMDLRSESVVYGCIKNIAVERGVEHRQNNRAAILELPSAESWSLVNREMFALPERQCANLHLTTDVMHFGASYQGVEHEWKYWLEQFESLLRKMYWVSAIVHLETEFSGLHSFIYEVDGAHHFPNQSNIKLRCEWARELV